MIKPLSTRFLSIVGLLAAFLLPIGCMADEPTANQSTAAGANANIAATATVNGEANSTVAVEVASDINLATQSTVYVEGEHYQLVPDAKDSLSETVLVQEFFWYGCPTCNNFEPSITRFRKNLPADTTFEQIPGASNPVWQQHARAFYTAEVLGVSDKTHEEMFAAIHKAGRPLRSDQDIKQFFLDAGVSEEQFDNTYNSFAVNTKIRNANRLAEEYGVSGVPTVVVNGKYSVTPSKAGGFAESIKVVRFLIEKEQN